MDISKIYNFDNVSTAVLNCSARVSNQLTKNSIKTLGDLFSLTINDFLSLNGIGVTTLTNLLIACKDFLKTKGYTDPYKKNVSMKEAVEIIKNYSNSLTNNEYFDLASVDQEYEIYIKKIDNIYYDLGEEFFKYIYFDSNANNYIVSVLNQIAESSILHTKINLIKQKTTIFLKKYPSAKTIPMISFEGIWKSINSKNLPEIFATEDLLVDIPKILLDNDEIPIKEKNTLAKQIISFLEFLSSDVKSQLKKIREDINDRDKHKFKEKIVELRDEGNTLEDISIILGLTRERVRQIYLDATIAFSKELKSSIDDFISLIHILSGRKKLLIKSDISSFFYDKTIVAWVWACLHSQKLYTPAYYYSKKYDAVVFYNEEGKLPDEIDLYTVFDIDSDYDFLTDNYTEEQKKLLVNISSDILERFIHQNSPVHKSKIFQNFPEFGKYTLPEAIRHCHNIISTENGYFLHTSTLSLCEKDRLFLKQYLEGTTIKSPLNINTAYTHCQHYMIDFLKQNDITESYKLFAILKFMFNENFDFNWPFIAKKNGRNITRDVIISILEPYEEINIVQLFDMITAKGYDPISFRNVLHLVYPDYIRVNNNKLMKSALIGLNGNIIGETLSKIYMIVEKEEYILPKNIKEYQLLPKICIRWNQHLLTELVLNTNVVKYILLENVRKNKFEDSIVFVSKKYETYDFKTFVLKILSDVYGQRELLDPENKNTWYEVRGLDIFCNPFSFITNDDV